MEREAGRALLLSVPFFLLSGAAAIRLGVENFSSGPGNSLSDHAYLDLSFFIGCGGYWENCEHI